MKSGELVDILECFCFESYWIFIKEGSVLTSEPLVYL